MSSAQTNDSENLAREFTDFKLFVLSSLRALQSQIEYLAKQVDHQEMYNRRKILLLRGVHEGQNEDVTAVVVATFKDRLKVTDFTANDLSRCHRLGHSTNTDKPRPILIELHNNTIRSKIWATKTRLKGSGIVVTEFLTKARHDAFMAARKRFGVGKAWTLDGYIFVVAADGTRHRVCCQKDLDNIDRSDEHSAPATLVKKATSARDVVKATSQPPAVIPPKTRRVATSKKQ